MRTSRTQGQPSDDISAFSLRGKTRESLSPEELLELTPARSLQDPAIALVALLVALVHHRGSYSVTFGNRTDTFQWPRQMRRCLRWRVTERD